MSGLWEEVQGSLREKLGSQSYEIWIRPIRVASMEDDAVQLEVPNRYYRERQSNYHSYYHSYMFLIIDHRTKKT